MSANRTKPQLGLIELVIPGKEDCFSDIQEVTLDLNVFDGTICEAEYFLELSAELIYQSAL
jgi:hypothetical protein